MKILNISAHNYRTLVDFELNLSRGYCPISGPNNAGKTCIIRILQHFLEDSERFYYYVDNEITLSRDKTKWADTDDMSVSITLEFDRDEDSETFFFIERFAVKKFEEERVALRVYREFDGSQASKATCHIGELELDANTSAEVIKKLRSSANIVVHNSTIAGHSRIVIASGFTELTESQIEGKDRKAIKEAETRFKNKVAQVAKKQKEHLSELLGRLNEDYTINLTMVEGFRENRVPIAISLQDRQVEVPLRDWGSGTRNRTEVLMSLMEAARTKAAASEENRTTPVVILEEPESFLHPHAQAEFGKLLGMLSDELGIQIIATTHSPYLLNHANPSANILLKRRQYRRKLVETEVVNTTGDAWMAPFAEILGIVTEEFRPWQGIIMQNTNKAVIVEGDIDKEYFELFREK